MYNDHNEMNQALANENAELHEKLAKLRQELVATKGMVNDLLDDSHKAYADIERRADVNKMGVDELRRLANEYLNNLINLKQEQKDSEETQAVLQKEKESLRERNRALRAGPAVDPALAEKVRSQAQVISGQAAQITKLKTLLAGHKAQERGLMASDAESREALFQAKDQIGQLKKNQASLLKQLACLKNHEAKENSESLVLVNTICAKDTELADKDTELADKDTEISALKAQLAKFKATAASGQPMYEQQDRRARGQTAFFAVSQGQPSLQAAGENAEGRRDISNFDL